RRVILHVVESLFRLHELVSEQSAELHRDVVGAQHFLTGNGQGDAAHVDKACCVTEAPEAMLPRAEAVSILAVTIEQTNAAFRHDHAHPETSAQSSVIVAKVQAVPKK